MPNYTAPLEDMMFLFDKLRNNKNYNEIEKYKEVNSELVKNILEEAAKINQNLILPLAKTGDENPTVLENELLGLHLVIKTCIKNLLKMVGPLYLVILNMEDKECQEL